MASLLLLFRLLPDAGRTLQWCEPQNCKGDKEFKRWQEMRLNVTYQSTNCQCCNFESLLSARNGRRRSYSSSSPIGCVAGSASRGRGGVGIQSWSSDFIWRKAQKSIVKLLLNPNVLGVRDILRSFWSGDTEWDHSKSRPKSLSDACWASYRMNAVISIQRWDIWPKCFKQRWRVKLWEATSVL